MKPKKITIPSLEERKVDHERKLRELELKNKLLGSPELFLANKGSDEYLDTLSMIIKLRGGEELTYEDYISKDLVEYDSHFTKAFYYRIARLYNLPQEVMDQYVKPQFVAFFTVQFIYARFPKKVVDILMSHAKWTNIPGIREIKLFQRLSPTATEQLDIYIEQCIRMMSECSTAAQFKQKYSKEYKLHFEVDMFEDYGITA